MGIGIEDWRLTLEVWIGDWDLGLGLGIGIEDWGLGLEVWIGDWGLGLGKDWGFGFGIGD